MKMLSALGLVAGGFLLVPKGAVVLTVIWALAKVNPVLGVLLFSGWLLLERLL
ncbi:hypothetical protein [Phaeovulum sp. NW3]|uniref:hypothetical protein n=1 Tax=Phaeovulum sp. NW3 TaxID=2934933 RepID=UPI002021B9B0|nr:hypothetical protein [Phaeovulum sp. NW3]MCL7465660.1 hypothetical protein [Phaeovulum sp. NW3]